MKKEHLLFALSLVLVALCFYLFFRILLPFLESILWAIFVGMVSYPVYVKLQRCLRNKRVLSAITMTLLVVWVLVLPFTLLFAVLGGIQTFGVIGVIAGPLIATLCVTLIEIYLREIRGLHHSRT